MINRSISFALLFCFVASAGLHAQEISPSPSARSAIATPVPAPDPSLDPAAATRAWLDTDPPNERAKSDAYFEGGYWLLLWNFLLAVAISIFLLQSRISARLRDFAEA